MNRQSKISEVISERMRVLGKSVEILAREACFDSIEDVERLMGGSADLPFETILPTAKALKLDPSYLFQLYLSEYHTELYKGISPYIEHMMTADELSFLRSMRYWVGSARVSALNPIQREKLNDFIRSTQPNTKKELIH